MFRAVTIQVHKLIFRVVLGRFDPDARDLAQRRLRQVYNLLTAYRFRRRTL